jgi:hypothetical protein
VDRALVLELHRSIVARASLSERYLALGLEESLLEDGQLQLGETITVPHDSYTFKMMPPTPELSRGYQKMVYFPPW